jgi:hypothetical protein
MYMEESTDTKIMEEGYKNIRKLRNIAALVPLFYLSLTLAFFYSGQFNGLLDLSRQSMLWAKTACFAVSLAVVPFRGLLFRTIFFGVLKIRQARSLPEFVSRYLKGSLLLLSCYELVAVLGVILFVLFGDLASGVLFILLSLLYYFFQFPDQNDYQGLAPVTLPPEPAEPG